MNKHFGIYLFKKDIIFPFSPYFQGILAFQ